jgi:hypothetical protein
MELEWLYVIILIVVFIVIVLKVKLPNWYGRHYVVSGEKPPPGSDERQ